MNGYTRHCREALNATREEAVRLGHASVGPEHILLGLLDLDDGIAAVAIDGLGMDRDGIRLSTAARLPASGTTLKASELQYSTQAKAVLQAALREARDDRTGAVHSGHLLLAALSVEGPSTIVPLEAQQLRSAIATAARVTGEPLDEYPESVGAS